MKNLNCGRVDAHEPHPISLPNGWNTGRVDYWCPGPPVTEGGQRTCFCAAPRYDTPVAPVGVWRRCIECGGMSRG